MRRLHAYLGKTLANLLLEAQTPLETQNNALREETR